MCEHLFVQKGSPHGRFTRAVERRNLLAAESAARELGQLSLSDALAFLFLVADKAPGRFERAAARWCGRFLVETRGVTIAEAQVLLGALAALREPAPAVALETIARVAERLRAQSVALQARRLL